MGFILSFNGVHSNENMHSFKYYLETNSIYKIRKIPEPILTRAFTSALTIWEILSGIDAKSYKRRKSICHQIIKSQITIDWRLPEEIIFESFSAGEEFEFIDNRGNLLIETFNLILSSETLDEFVSGDTKETWKYFETHEARWRDRYISVAVAGIKSLQQLINDKPNESIVFEGKHYTLNTIKDVQHFLNKEFAVNRAISINAFMQILLNSSALADAGFTQQEVYESYNGWIDHFIDVFSKKATLIIGHQQPEKNDFIDLLHITYLRNFPDCKIVSDDKIFSICVDLRILTEDIISHKEL